MSAEGREPTEEELRQAFEEQMKRISVDDVLVQTAVTLVNLAGRRLGLGLPPEELAEQKDVDQARTAIEAVRALMPLLPQDTQQPIRDALSQLQMAYAREAQGGAEAQAGGDEPAGEPAAEQKPAQDAEAAREAEERAKARAKLWTPPGS